MAKLKLALVGCGRICEVAHFPGYEQHAADLVEITACVDINAARAELLAGKAGPQCQVFTSLDDALAEGDFDAVDLMLLHTDHESAIMACFAAGKHVLMEKPMATSVAECSRIMQAAEESGKTFMISEQSQYWAPVVRAQELIASGAIGNVTSVTAYYKQASTTNMWANVLDGAGGQGDAKGVATHETGEPKPWRYDKRLTGGGVSIDGGAHWLRPMNMLTPGKIEEVIGVIGHPFQPMEGESFARALCRFDSGVVSTFETDYSDSTFFGPENAFKVIGDGGEITCNPGGDVMVYNAETGRKGVAHPTENDNGHGKAIEDFANVVLHGARPKATASDSLGELRTALAIYKSAETKQWENVWADDLENVNLAVETVAAAAARL